MIACKGKSGGLRSRPHQHTILYSKVGGRIKLFARHNDTDNGFPAIVLNLDILAVERNLHAIILELVVDDRGIVDMPTAYGSCLGLDNKEVLQWFGTVHGSRKVRKIIPELHGLIVHAIHPTAQHGNFWCRVSPQGVACITEMLEGNGLLRPGGIQILGYTGREQQLTTMTIVHQQFDGTQRTIILPDDISTGRPCPCVVIHSKAILIRTIDEALVLPAIAPRVGDNPGSYLVFFHLANDTVTIQVELDTVVISTDRKCMVKGIAPCLDILHAHNTCSLVGYGVGNSSPGTIGSNTYTGHTTAMHSSVSTVVIEPLLELLTSLGSIGGT